MGRDVLSPLTVGVLLLCTVSGAGLVSLSGCRSVPVTGRRQLVTVSEEEENRLGLAAWQEVLETEEVSDDEAQRVLVERVGQRIAAVANRDDFAWEFNVIESETQNAFCLPGGKVAIYSGILPVCETEAGLAVVMSHEIGHAIARHGGERMSQKMVQNLGQNAVGRVLKNQDESKQKIALTAFGFGSEYGVILPYSRTHELEADQIGLMLMARAGYDPSAAPEFWERFADEKAGGTIEFLSTHPSDSRRSAALREQIPKAMELYSQAAEQHGLGEQIPKRSAPAATADSIGI